MKQVIKIEGMVCPLCQGKVEKALKKIKTVKNVEVSYEKGTAWILTDRKVSNDELEKVLSVYGYSIAKGKPWVSIFTVILTVLIFFLIKSILNERINLFPAVNDASGYFGLFVTGLFTSFHCVCMCGGINLNQSVSAARNKKSPALSGLQYQAGRLISYSLTGGIIGLLGSAFSLSISLRSAIMIAAGLLMVVMALNQLGLSPSLRKYTPKLSFLPAEQIIRMAKDKSSFITGFLNGFLPCGPLQAMQLYALGTGSFIHGALSMACFCLGTMPLVFVSGYIFGFINKKSIKAFSTISAGLILAFGLSMAEGGLAVSGINLLPTVSFNDATDASGDGSLALSGTEEVHSGTATVLGDKQNVYSEASYGSYEPITVQKGIPVVWTLNIPEGKLTGCNNSIIIPEYKIQQKLHEGENTIEFLPEETGSFQFTCWMGMIRSTINVVDNI